MAAFARPSQAFQQAVALSYPRNDSQFYFCTPEQVQRISTWRMNIQHCTDTSEASTSQSTSSRSRHRQQKPYARPEQRTSARNSVSSDNYVTDGFEQPTPRHPVHVPTQPVEDHELLQSGQVHYIAKPRKSNDLPDPARNPLVTRRQDDIEQEYLRVAHFFENLQDQKRDLEESYIRQASPALMQRIMDVGASIQRVTNSAQYIVAYSHELGLNVNFSALILHIQQQRASVKPAPRQATIQMPQPRAFGEGWKFNQM
ncbi:hypothetical protein CVT26_000064 [Gymnopilus dilepis]|uniref:Uncharacterized protein n=1 Tax=Gymnopilus dilepis TaxID=231916 RepID=A0A409VGG1_9AGAR|nr:hypothetical protein CVT26_000064 [Gymnopilus dilepis]